MWGASEPAAKKWAWPRTLHPRRSVCVMNIIFGANLSFNPSKFWTFDIIEILDDHYCVVPIQLRVQHLLSHTTQCLFFLLESIAIFGFRSQSRTLKKVLLLVHLCAHTPFAEHHRSVIQKTLIKHLGKLATPYQPHKFFFLQNDRLNLSVYLCAVPAARLGSLHR